MNRRTFGFSRVDVSQDTLFEKNSWLRETRERPETYVVLNFRHLRALVNSRCERIAEFDGLGLLRELCQELVINPSLDENP